MANFDNAIIQIQQLRTLSSRLRRKLLGDARSDLANAITDHILVFADQVYHLESGRSAQLSASAGSGRVQADELAALASQLLGAAGEDRYIKLFLAPSEFVGASLPMPGITGENLHSALFLQKDTLLPAYDKGLALATVDSPGRDTDTVTALWLPEKRLEELFAAFNSRNLLLAIVQPRVFCSGSSKPQFSLLEDDGENLTAVGWQDGVAVRWLQMHKADLQESAFSEQWQEALESLTEITQVDQQNLEHYLSAQPDASPDYSFFPQGAIDARKKVEKKRQLVLAASVLVGILALSALPFLLQSMELRMAEARLQAAREMSADARADQRIVVDFENEWGTINDFPDQQVRQAMFRLQEVLGSERLSSLELSEGLIRIQGTSAEPQAILQRLEQDPMFTEVVFSRATNNTRYYIDLRLAAVNFEAYMLRYFPDGS